MNIQSVVTKQDAAACLDSEGTLVMPYGTAAIAPYAFSNCTDLFNVAVPDSVALIGWNAFENTPWLESRPDGVVYAGKVLYVYKGEMPPDTRITLLDDTIGIAGGAFRLYKNLVGITIPAGLKAIGSIAFFDCRNLSDVIIPGSVMNIGAFAFEGTAWYDNQPDGMVYAGKVAYRYKGTIPREAHISLRDGTVSISTEAFAHADKLHRLRTVTIPESVESIGDRLFANCAQDFSGNITIRCANGSYAQYYASTNGVKTEIM